MPENEQKNSLEGIVEEQKRLWFPAKAGVSMIEFYQHYLSKIPGIIPSAYKTARYTKQRIKSDGFKAGLKNGLKEYGNFLKETGSMCLYHPTCSEYTKQAVMKYGLFLGSLKGAKRIFSCQPFTYNHRKKKDPVNYMNYPVE